MNQRRPWTDAETLAAARQVLLAPGAVTRGFEGIDVRDDADRLLVEFQWLRDPNHYVVDFPYPEDATSAWTGLPVSDAQEWAVDIAFLLMEELDTGFVARARRTRRGNAVALAFDAFSEDVLGREWYVGNVLPENDWIIEDAALDPSVPRQRRQDGTLIAWLSVHPNTIRFGPVAAHGAISWMPGTDDVATLDMIQMSEDVASDVQLGLARLLVFQAMYAGARGVVSAQSGVLLMRLGFTSLDGATWTVSTLDYGTST